MTTIANSTIKNNPAPSIVHRQRRRAKPKPHVFVTNVTKFLERRDWSAPKLARRAGISPKTLNNLLRGRHSARLDVLESIAEALDVELWVMFLPRSVTSPKIFRRVVTKAATLPATSLERIEHRVGIEATEIWMNRIRRQGHSTRIRRGR